MARRTAAVHRRRFELRCTSPATPIQVDNEVDECVDSVFDTDSTERSARVKTTRIADLATIATILQPCG